MLYSEYLDKAYEETIIQAENGLFYLEPTWKVILIENDLDPKKISDYKTDWTTICDVLKLQVEKQNAINSKKNYVIDWVYNVITSTVEPAMLEEETDYLKNVTEYLKANHEAQKIQEKNRK